MKNLHQCLIAEVAFDPVPIPAGKDPSNWDKLAQRNLAWSDVGSATAVTTFEIRPSPVGLPVGQRVDELMIDWGSTPAGSVATLYLPGVDADEILDIASRIYVSSSLERVDEHTIRCEPRGITYLPIPAASGADRAGLLTVEPPGDLDIGQEFTVAVRQVTNAFAGTLREKDDRIDAAPAKRRRRSAPTAALARAAVGQAAVSQEGNMARGGYDLSQWRRVMGAFQLTVPVKPKQSLLFTEERHLSVLRWIFEAIPTGSRWYPVFERYVDVIGGRVRAFGGDPTQVQPSPFGHPRHGKEPPGTGEHDGPRDDDPWGHGPHDHGPHGHGSHGEERFPNSGKIAGLMFDRFGDFEGFVLEADERERRYFSRERDIEILAERAWRERLRVTVFSEPDEPQRAESIVIWEPPVPL